MLRGIAWGCWCVFVSIFHVTIGDMCDTCCPGGRLNTFTQYVLVYPQRRRRRRDEESELMQPSREIDDAKVDDEGIEEDAA